jgi:hypothetical protein
MMNEMTLNSDDITISFTEENNVNKYLEIFKKVNDTYTITDCSNGYMIEITGENANEEWITSKVICTNNSELVSVLSFLKGIAKR